MIALIAALAAGYAAGRASSAVPAAIPAAAGERETTAAHATLDAQEVEAWVRSAVRAELASLRADASTSGSTAATPTSPVTDSQFRRLQEDRRADALEGMLDDALRRGRWELDDQIRLREALGTVSDPQRETALLQRLAAAVNAGELEIGFEGPMF